MVYVHSDTQRQDKERTHPRHNRVIARASKMITERRLNWYGHVMRRDAEHILRKVLRTIFEEKVEKTTENELEGRVPRREKYWTEIERGDGHGDMEKEDN